MNTINVLCFSGHFQNILEALRRVTAGRTTIVIAHRLSTVVDADQILVLDKGRVVERGTHHQLISNPDSLYTQLWNKQSAVTNLNDGSEQGTNGKGDVNNNNVLDEKDSIPH